MPKKLRGLSNPVQLEPFDREDKTLVNVVIETVKGSRNKFAFDQEAHIFRLKKVLPEGMSFPHDFGFIPRTRAADGDPIDVLLLMDEPAFTGCLVPARLVGVIEAEQTEDGQKVRNDRLLAVAAYSHTHSGIRSIKDLNPHMLKEIEAFFGNYQQLAGVRFKALGRKGPARAMKLVKNALRAKRR